MATAVLTQPWAAIWAKALVDPFFHSTSAGAALTLLGFAAMATVRLALGSGQLPLAVQRLALAGILVTVLVGNAGNLIAHLQLMSRLELPASVALYHWVGDSNTYSYLLHTHAGKTAVDWMLAGALDRLAPSYDMGRAMAQAVPAWTAPLCAGAMALASMAGLVALPGMASGPRPRVRLALFCFCALSCIKSIADGGPLTYHFIPAFLVLAWMSAQSCGWVQQLTRCAVAIAAVSITAYIVVWLSVGDEPGLEAFVGFGGTLAVLGLLGWQGLPRPARSRPVALGLGLACAGGVAWAVLGALVATPLALSLPLDEGTEATRCDLGSLHCTRLPVHGQSAYAVYRSTGDDPLKPHHTFIAPQQAPGASQLVALIHPLRTVAPRVTPGSAVAVTPVQRMAGTANVVVALRAATVPAIFNPAPSAFSTRNYHVFMHLAAAQLRAQGLQDFALVPLLRQADADAVGLRSPH